MSRTIAHVVLIVAGLLIMVYPVTVGAGAAINCRGVAMQPGSSCVKADGSSAQTYEQRARARRAATPVLMVVGLGVAGFGLTLLLTGRRRPQLSNPQASKTVAS
jgi:drug/metabolite transporter (DMT)-like permease